MESLPWDYKHLWLLGEVSGCLVWSWLTHLPTIPHYRMVGGCAFTVPQCSLLGADRTLCTHGCACAHGGVHAWLWVLRSACAFHCSPLAKLSPFHACAGIPCPSVMSGLGLFVISPKAATAKERLPRSSSQGFCFGTEGKGTER